MTTPDFARLIDELSDRFEAAWNAGLRPQIEEYLESAPAGAREALLRELLVMELELRARAGDDTRLDDYVARFPDFADMVREAFGTTPTVRHGAKIDPEATSDHRAQPWAMHVRCPHCHNPIEIVESDSLREIKCPSCNSLFSLVGNDAQRADAVGKVIGHFELLERLGTGGFGTVWKARDTKLDRIVALKIPRRSQLDADELEKFFREARAAAQLKHPNIVSVHEVGRDGETVYIVSDYIEGLPLDKWLAGEQEPAASAVPLTVSGRALAPGGRKFTAREAASLCEKIARALHHAHEAGVVHRDLKPSNIILDRSGDPHVMDFGLAKREAGEITMTVDGQILGTPAYMSPEQARGEGHQADRRTDVYSLGVILYQLLTGELPFRGSLRMLLAQVLEDEPTAPRRLDSTIPRDTETIALRCLEKDPGKRYVSTQDLADELARFLRHEPIHARRIGSASHAWRWCKRNPVIAGLTVAVVAVLFAGTMTSSFFALRANNKASLADSKTKEAIAASQAANAQLLQMRTAEYVTKINSVERALQSHDLSYSASTLEELSPDLRGWEHAYLWTQLARQSVELKDHSGHVSTIAFSPDGRRIAIGGSGRTLTLLNTTTGQKLLTFKGIVGAVASVSFSPDGQRIVSGINDNTRGEIKVWVAETGQEVLAFKGELGPVTSVAFSSDGQRVVSGSSDNTVKVWDSATGQEVLTLKGHTDVVSSVDFSHDGRRVVSGSWDKTVKVWDVATGQESMTFKGHTGGILGVNCVAFSPDGRWIVSGGGDQRARVWDVSNGREVVTLDPFFRPVVYVTFVRDGRRIFAASDGDGFREWDSDTGRELARFQVGGYISHLALSPDEQHISFTCSANALTSNSKLMLWNTLSTEMVRKCNIHDGPIISIATSPNDQHVISGSADATVRMWDPATGSVKLTLKGHTKDVTGVAFSSDGRTIISGSADKTLKVWDSATGEIIKTFKGHLYDILCVAVSPNGGLIVAGGGDDEYIGDKTDVRGHTELKGWDAMTGEYRLLFRGHTALVSSIAFSPDGRQIVSGSFDKTLKLWDASTGKEVLTFLGHTAEISKVAFSPDGKFVASASKDMTTRVWNASNGKVVLTLEGMKLPVVCVSFSPDGKRIVSGGTDRRLTIWDTATGQALLTLKGHGVPVYNVLFSRDGRRMFSGGLDNTIFIWDATDTCTKSVESPK